MAPQSSTGTTTLPVHVFFNLLSPTAKLPKKQHNDDAGYDVTSVEDVVLHPGKPTPVGLGISVASSDVKQHYYMKIESRSGLAVKGVSAIGGIIDSGYRGEIKAILINHTQTPITILAGDRVAQLIIYPILNITPVEATPADQQQTTRGAGGFGSTGA